MLRAVPGGGVGSMLSAPNTLFSYSMGTLVLRRVWAAAQNSNHDPVLYSLMRQLYKRLSLVVNCQ